MTVANMLDEEERGKKATFQYRLGTNRVEYMINILEKSGYDVIRNGHELMFSSGAWVDLGALKERGMIQWYQVEQIEKRLVEEA